MRYNLVLSGGGTRGAAQLGAVHYLRLLGWDPAEIVGTSAGALNAVLLGTGKSPKAAKELLRTLRPEVLLKRRNAISILFGGGTKGVFDTSKLEQAIKNHVPSSYSEFAIPVRLTTANWSTGRGEIHSSGNPRTHARASMSLPVFDMVKIGKHLHEDGGVHNNYAIDVGGWRDPNLPLIGVSYAPANSKPLPPPKTKVGRVIATINHMLAALDREHWEDVPQARHIVLDSGPHSGLDLDQTEQDVEDLWKRGISAAKRFREANRALFS